MCAFTSRSARAAKYSECSGDLQVATQRGIALIAVLLALLVVTIMGIALNAFGVLSVTIATNERQGTEALYVADAGISHARRLLLAMIQNPPVQPPPGVSVMDQFLTRGDGVACNGDELAPAPPAPFVPGDAIPAGGAVFPAGSGNSYRVAVCDDDGQVLVENGNMLVDTNGVIIARAFAVGPNGSNGALEITVSRVPLPGLLVDGNLNLSGTPVVTGFGGAIHANGNLQIDGSNPCADDYMSATGWITTGSKGKTGNCPSGTDSPADKRPGSSNIPVPPMPPENYRSQADFLLGNDGVIRNQAGANITGSVPGWAWDSGGKRWVKSSNSITPGTYFADDRPLGTPGTANAATSIEISGNPNGQVTLIATAYINISGNPGFTPDLNVGGVSISMLAGTDLIISGNPATLYQGVHYAGHQLQISGNPTVNGQVIAANLSDFPIGGDNYSKIVQLDSGFIKISGNPTINVNAAGLLASLLQTGWRECRGTANPANPCQ